VINLGSDFGSRYNQDISFQHNRFMIPEVDQLANVESTGFNTIKHKNIDGQSELSNFLTSLSNTPIDM